MQLARVIPEEVATAWEAFEWRGAKKKAQGRVERNSAAAHPPADGRHQEPQAAEAEPARSVGAPYRPASKAARRTSR